MLVIQKEQMVNMDLTFSVKAGGQGDRYLHFRGSDSLSVDMPFKDRNQALLVRDRIAENVGNDVAVMDVDAYLEDDE